MATASNARRQREPMPFAQFVCMSSFKLLKISCVERLSTLSKLVEHLVPSGGAWMSCERLIVRSMNTERVTVWGAERTGSCGGREPIRRRRDGLPANLQRMREGVSPLSQTNLRTRANHLCLSGLSAEAQKPAAERAPGSGNCHACSGWDEACPALYFEDNASLEKEPGF